MADHIRYDLLTQQALRGVVRSVLGDVAKKGLPDDHHFFIEFDTHADGVRMSDRLRAQHPDKMTIILQHQFWDLAVSEQAFEVGLSFGGITERLAVPFEAITGFYDPSVQFGLQFEEVREDQGQQAPANAPEKPPAAGQKRTPDKPGKSKRVPSIAQNVSVTESTATAAAASDPQPDKPSGGGGEVVRLDRFRKK